jgi:hypothetical protein
MKKQLKVILFAILLIAASLVASAQHPPHNNEGSTHGVGNGPVGGGATLGSGLSLLFAMGLSYGLHKYYQKKNNTSLPD